MNLFISLSSNKKFIITAHEVVENKNVNVKEVYLTMHDKHVFDRYFKLKYMNETYAVFHSIVGKLTDLSMFHNIEDFIEEMF